MHDRPAVQLWGCFNTAQPPTSLVRSATVSGSQQRGGWPGWFQRAPGTATNAFECLFIVCFGSTQDGDAPNAHHAVWVASTQPQPPTFLVRPAVVRAVPKKWVAGVVSDSSWHCFPCMIASSTAPISALSYIRV